ncbi:hypothetical protein DSAG12_01744 [Promethearchaeum syntrophicum]|uniref:Uncharacterized protein n=1 Tax=Promethearchaeum syntrophicum TaxID=2594042 RepID=A0A5B9DAS1_9ARCH|nr:hypothetical protein [Candidatus Prometheoarchaeum syntrophicum]QEE15917.1 hypothetical protein DSAG12_01744 [Candidatus Prometheoarchaeum syntrophicum]
MGKKKKSHRQKRGYPIGLIIGFESMQINIWKVFSERVLIFKVRKLGRKFENAQKSHLYHFFEDIINDLRPIMKEGIKSILLVCPLKKDYASLFLNHIKSHHKWLILEKNINSASFQILHGSVRDLEEVSSFIQTDQYLEAIGSVTEKETNRIIETLEKRLNDLENGLVLYTLKEIEEIVYSGGKRKKKFKPLSLIPEHILFTNSFIDENPQKNRIHRLIQIAKNRQIISKIIDSETPAGIRINQLGGIVCFLLVKSDYEKKIGQKIIDR